MMDISVQEHGLQGAKSMAECFRSSKRDEGESNEGNKWGGIRQEKPQLRDQIRLMKSDPMMSPAVSGRRSKKQEMR